MRDFANRLLDASNHVPNQANGPKGLGNTLGDSLVTNVYPDLVAQIYVYTDKAK